jgi:hypothetical protein
MKSSIKEAQRAYLLWSILWVHTVLSVFADDVSVYVWVLMPAWMEEQASE